MNHTSEELRKTSLKGLDIRVIVRYQYIRKSCLSKETGFRACQVRDLTTREHIESPWKYKELMPAL